MEVLNLGYR